MWLHPDSDRVRFSMHGWWVLDKEVMVDSSMELRKGVWNHLLVTIDRHEMVCVEHFAKLVLQATRV